MKYKKILILLLSVVLAMSIPFFFTAFTEMSFNVIAWGKSMRAATAFLAIAFGAAAVLANNLDRL